MTRPTMHFLMLLLANADLSLWWLLLGLALHLDTIKFLQFLLKFVFSLIRLPLQRYVPVLST